MYVAVGKRLAELAPTTVENPHNSLQMVPGYFRQLELT